MWPATWSSLPETGRFQWEDLANIHAGPWCGRRARLQLRGSGGISPRFPNIPLRANQLLWHGAHGSGAAELSVMFPSFEHSVDCVKEGQPLSGTAAQQNLSHFAAVE